MKFVGQRKYRMVPVTLWGIGSGARHNARCREPWR